MSVIPGVIAVVCLAGILAVGLLGGLGLMMVDRYWQRFRADH